MPGSVIVGGARTPIGKLSGALNGFTAMDLGGFAIKAALERSGDPSLLSQPSNAILKALGREGKTPADVDLFEINEAFAAVALQSMRDMDITDENVNVNGGAISMGHPVGASGARVALHLALELGRRGGGLGVAGLCGGGGQGEALVLRVPA
jgi:acetyl-CoA C-acetyltransferase